MRPDPPQSSPHPPHSRKRVKHDPRHDPFGPEGHPLCGRGASRAKWATAGVMFSTVVFFVLPISLGWPLAPLHLTGSGFGLAMYILDSYGLSFQSALRQLVSEHRTRILRAHCVILSVACLLLPLLLALLPDICFASPQPVGLAVLAGSMLFGAGMMLSQMDTINMLLGAGRGSSTAWATLIGFIFGSALSAPTDERMVWDDAPRVAGAWTITEKIGTVPAVGIQLGALCAIFVGSLSLERLRHSRVEPLLSPLSTVSESMSEDTEYGLPGEQDDDDSMDDTTPRDSVDSDLSAAETAGLLSSGDRVSTHITGESQTNSEWRLGEPVRTVPFGWGFLAVVSLSLAGTNALSLVVGSHCINPGIGGRMWGLEIGAIFGEHHPHAQLNQASVGEVTPVLVQASSQNLSFILVALCIAIFTQTTEWCISLETSWRRLLVCLCGGVMMGYGAAVSWGDCVGGIWSAVASTSVHGWLWCAGVLMGSWIGVQVERLCVNVMSPSSQLYFK